MSETCHSRSSENAPAGPPGGVSEFTLTVPPVAAAPRPGRYPIQIAAPFQVRCRWVGDDHLLARVEVDCPVRLTCMPAFVGQLYFRKSGGRWSLVREFTAMAYATRPDKIKECGVEPVVSGAVVAALQQAKL